MIIAPVPPSQSPWSVSLRIGAIAAIGSEPSVVPGGTFGIDVANPSIAIGVEGRLDGEGSRTTARWGESVHGRVVAGGAFACLQHAFGRVTPRGCILAQAGATFARAMGVDQSTPQSFPYVAMGLRAGVDIDVVGPLFAFVAIDALATVTPAAATIDDVDPSTGAVIASHVGWTTSWVTGAFGAGLGVHFR